MPVRALLFAHRKPGVTPTEFRNHLEGPHMSLLKQLFGDLFPRSHVRRYVQRLETDGIFPATMIVGEQAKVDYDVISELTFDDEAAFKAFFAKFQEEDVHKALEDDQEQFMVTSKIVAFVISEVAEDRRA